MNRRHFLAAAGALATVPALAAPAIAAEDDTAALAAMFASPNPVKLEPRVYRVRPDTLCIKTPGKRITGPGGHASVCGGAIIEGIGAGEALLRVAGHSAVIDGVQFRGEDCDRLVHAEQGNPGWGDVDLTLNDCTFKTARDGVVIVGRGLFARDCIFADMTGTFVTIDFPKFTAAPKAHWQTKVGGARKFILNGCYFHNARKASIHVASRLIHGLQVVACHHDNPQPFISGHLNGAVVTGNCVYRLGGDAICLTGRSSDSVISGNSFAGDRGNSPFLVRKMRSIVSSAYPLTNVVIAGNVRSDATGPETRVTGRIVK